MVRESLIEVGGEPVTVRVGGHGLDVMAAAVAEATPLSRTELMELSVSNLVKLFEDTMEETLIDEYNARQE